MFFQTAQCRFYNNNGIMSKKILVSTTAAFAIGIGLSVCV